MGKQIDCCLRKWHLGKMLRVNECGLMQQMGPWESREMAANAITFLNVPDGFANAAVVPYDPQAQQLLPEAAVSHLGNRYCGHRAHVAVSHLAPAVEHRPDEAGEKGLFWGKRF